MKIKNKIFNVCFIAIFVFIFIAALCFSGCGASENESSQNVENSEIIDNNPPKEDNEVIQLDSFNYMEYFIIQEEILSYEQNRYNERFGYGEVVSCIRVTQMTKIYILPLKSNMTFIDVEMKVLYRTNRYAILKLAYDGTGFTTVTDTYDGKLSEWIGVPVKHKVYNVTGSVSIKL